MALDTTTRMLAPFLDRLTDDELDALPYGVVQLNSEGRILSFNRAEIVNSGWQQPRPIGRDYFGDVAPSSFVPEIFGRYVEAFSSHQLDEVFRFTFTHADLPRTVLLRMYYSARTGSMWLFTAKPDGSPIGNGDGFSIDSDHEHARVA